MSSGEVEQHDYTDQSEITTETITADVVGFTDNGSQDDSPATSSPPDISDIVNESKTDKTLSHESSKVKEDGEEDAFVVLDDCQDDATTTSASIPVPEGNVSDSGIVKLMADEITELHVTLPTSQQVTEVLPKSSDQTDQLSKSEKELKNLCQNMFLKLENFLEGEVASSVNDYALLERMNKATTLKYQNVLSDAKSVVQGMHEVNSKFIELRPYLEQIEQIEQEVAVLEKAAYRLDGYAKRLEERFRKLEKR